MSSYSRILCVASILATSALQAAPAPFTGSFTEVDPSPFASISSQFAASNFQIDGTAAPIWNGAVIYCLDYEAESLSQHSGWNGPTDTFSGNVVDMSDIQAWGRYTGDNQDIAVAMAQVSYAIDTYYQQVLTGTATENRAFALTLWELVYDGGSDQGIDLFQDNFDSGRSSQADSAEILANTWLQAIDSANVQASYESQSVFMILDDLDNNDQDYVMISQYAAADHLPEPSSSLLLSMAGVALIFRRNRK